MPSSARAADEEDLILRSKEGKGGADQGGADQGGADQGGADQERFKEALLVKEGRKMTMTVEERLAEDIKVGAGQRHHHL